MSDRKITSKDIARTLATGLFHFRRCVAVPNVSWGLLPWEADLLVLNSSGYLYEVEIKVSIADLKRDRAKGKWRRVSRAPTDLLRAMWFAMPAEVWAHKDAAEVVPEHAGVIVVDPFAPLKFERSRVVREAKPNRSAQKVSAADKFQLARLGVMRFWSQKDLQESVQ